MGTHYKGSDKEVLALNTWIKLARANNDGNIQALIVCTLFDISQVSLLEVLYGVNF